MTGVGLGRGSEVTAREAEVLALLGRHLTNVQIAEALCISVRTVESHVSALLRKLGLPDRRSLARRHDAETGARARSVAARCRCRSRPSSVAAPNGRRWRPRSPSTAS